MKTLLASGLLECEVIFTEKIWCKTARKALSTQLDEVRRAEGRVVACGLSGNYYNELNLCYYKTQKF